MIGLVLPLRFASAWALGAFALQLPSVIPFCLFVSFEIRNLVEDLILRSR